MPTLRRKASNPLLKGFEVCDVPLSEICQENVSRDKCIELKCCFQKQLCLKKAVPKYVSLFIIMIVVVLGIFLCFVAFGVWQEKRKKRMAQRHQQAAGPVATPQERDTKSLKGWKEATSQDNTETQEDDENESQEESDEKDEEDEQARWQQEANRE
ncbi:testis-expressed protein 29 [Tachyglossus aculeatus]|uniref:testis-expressed protein 29 n=1 Tax=Tachyglossus aculeatus TaxID=9261 RepID=UPI0018F4E31F|nr:testis-expressed protein 29 [Tachyglossus aculeatus]XP_038618056.1 testis-expressed protein 29 [Tachyglossus aculeatus]